MGSGSRADHDSRKTLPSTQRLGCLFCIKNDYLLVILKALILAGYPAYSQVTRSHVEEEASPSRHMTLEVKSKTSTACSYFFDPPPPRPSLFLLFTYSSIPFYLFSTPPHRYSSFSFSLPPFPLHHLIPSLSTPSHPSLTFLLTT